MVSMKDFNSLSKYEDLFISQEPIVMCIESKLKPGFSIFDIDPLEFAQQIALISFDCFKKIKHSELHHMNWNAKKKNILSPNLTNLIQKFNQVRNWIISSILSEKRVKKRAELWEYILRVIIHLYEIGDFNSSKFFISGINSGPVYRLRYTRSLVSTSLLETFKTLEQDTAQNNRTFRKIMNERKPPLVPYIGICLIDLTFIEEGNPTMIKDNVVNWRKSSLKFQSIQSFLALQSVGFPFKKMIQIQEKIIKEIFNQIHEQLDDSVMFEKSRELEPRGCKMSNLL
jgi:son of sevenless